MQIAASGKSSSESSRLSDAMHVISFGPHCRSFKLGTIKQIRVNNFMTYGGTVTIRPGPRLNLVLGPNGTGKSSLVCAICVGLGGSTKVLGRADNLSEFIRRGQRACWTEITLSGGQGRNDHVLKRYIESKAAGNGEKLGFESHWELNSNRVNAKHVKDLISSLNIQFDNLCQFLPQASEGLGEGSIPTLTLTPIPGPG